jgi:arginine kinase
LEVDPNRRMNVNEALANHWLQGKATKSDHLSNSVDSMRVIVNKKKTQAFLNKQALRSRVGKPSLVQKYLPKDCWLWLQKSTKYGTSLVDCVKSAVQNPDSSVGLYAPDPECYDTFPEIFWPVISDYHKIDAYSIQNVHDFGDPGSIPEFEPKYADSIISTRIRVGRSLEGYPMGPKLSRETREEIKLEMLESFKNLQDDLYGDFIELNEMSYDERDSLIKSHYLFADADDKYLESAGGYADWPLNRGIYMNRSKTFLVWINEEDHVRIISIQKGSNIKQVYTRLVKGIKILEKQLRFVYHKKFGYLTFCPTNIGTGLRASVHVKLPKLAASGRLNDLCNSLGLQARGMHGEHRESEEEEDRGVYDISNKVRIGRSEFDLVISMYDGIKKLLNEEYAIK